MGATETLLFLLLDLAIIVTAARASGAVARRLGQPAVIGEILAGILLGPTVFGRVAPDLQVRVFPPTVPLASLADLGLVFFMFLVGLELDPRLIRKEGRRALSISLSGVLVPFILGVVISLPLHAVNNAGVFVTDMRPPPTLLAFSLFMGAALCITAFPVLARILVERGLYKSPLGTSTLCAAAIDDVTAWILLAGVVGLTRSGSPGRALTALLLTAVFAAFMLIVSRPTLSSLARRYESSGRLTVDQVAIVVVGLLLSAAATEWIGIHSIFGAFIFGTVMPHHSRMTRELTDKIEDFTVIVLLPVFFTVAGLRTNLFAINTGMLAGWLLLIIAAAIVGKLAGCGIAARINGYSTRDSVVLGTLMNTRGLTELVILTVGLSLGVLSDRTFAMMVIMALVTTFMAAPILNWIMPRREMVRVLAGGDSDPSVRRVLVAVDNPDAARTLVDAGIRLLGSHRPAELLLVRLVATPRAPEFRSGMRDEQSHLDRSMDVMEALLQQAASHTVGARTVSFLSDDLAQDLALVAGTQQCEALLLGWPRGSPDRHVLRAFAHRLFSSAPCDVIVFVDPFGNGLAPHPAGSVVLITTSPGMDPALARIAERLAESLHTPMRIHAGSDAISGGGPIAAAVVGAGQDWNDASDFGEPATSIASALACPVLIVRPLPVSTTPAAVDASYAEGRHHS